MYTGISYNANTTWWFNVVVNRGQYAMVWYYNQSAASQIRSNNKPQYLC